MTPCDIHNLVAFSEMNMSTELVSTYLCRESMSLSKISTKAIDSLISKLTSPIKKFESLDLPKRMNSFNRILTFKFNDSIQKPSELSNEEILENGQKLFLRLADFLYGNCSLNDLIHHKVWYKVIDGREYQLIRLKDLYD